MKAKAEGADKFNGHAQQASDSCRKQHNSKRLRTHILAEHLRALRSANLGAAQTVQGKPIHKATEATPKAEVKGRPQAKTSTGGFCRRSEAKFRKGATASYVASKLLLEAIMSKQAPSIPDYATSFNLCTKPLGRLKQGSILGASRPCLQISAKSASHRQAET